MNSVGCQASTLPVGPTARRHDLGIIAAAGEQIERAVAAPEAVEAQHLGGVAAGVERESSAGPARRRDRGGDVGGHRLDGGERHGKAMAASSKARFIILLPLSYVLRR